MDRQMILNDAPTVLLLIRFLEALGRAVLVFFQESNLNCPTRMPDMLTVVHQTVRPV